MVELRRGLALEARRELDQQARAAYPGVWRRFEAGELREAQALELDEGPLLVHSTLRRVSGGLEVRFEWSQAEAARSYREGAVALARIALGGQARDLERRIGGDAQLLLSAAPYFSRDALVETLLDMVFRRACFGVGEPPRDRVAFEAALDRGRGDLQASLEEIAATAAGWFAQAREVRQLLDDARQSKSLAEAAEEARVRTWPGGSTRNFSARSPTAGRARLPATCAAKSGAGSASSRVDRSPRRCSPSCGHGHCAIRAFRNRRARSCGVRRILTS